MSHTNLDQLLGQGGPEIYSVSRLTREARALLEASFPAIWVEGEISNLVQPASGHLYFTLKDDGSQVRCALFRGRARNQRVVMRNGGQVRLRARVSLYEGRGEFQLIVDMVEAAGEGQLQQAFNKLVATLKAEGLFEPARKRPLPTMPERIGVITSPTGAVIHDIITTLGRRFPAIPIRLFPVAVQGDESVPQLLAAIRAATLRRDCDVLIIGRGGGSLEDLWSFNDEAVVRALAECPIPIVSAIGHETDVTIADFVADVRAPTPTAAAEMLSPSRLDLTRGLDRQMMRLTRQMEYRLGHLQQTLDHLAHRLIHPETRLEQLRQKLQQHHEKIMSSMRSTLQQRNLQLSRLQGRFGSQSPASRLPQLRVRGQAVTSKLVSAVRHHLERAENRLASRARLLHGISPLATLERGYSLAVAPETGAIIRRPEQVQTGDIIENRLAGGRITSSVISTDSTKPDPS
ncbi:MAG: exodeoxyribonuclease VII large subunit [Gammaproteobacteria bacterium]|nr:exodeoxyribonuclease VII large subunit [Gammaproteobacteria bacterium]